MKHFKIKSIEDANVNVETLIIKRTVGDLLLSRIPPPTLRVCYRNVRMGEAHSKEEAGGLEFHLGH